MIASVMVGLVALMVSVVMSGLVAVRSLSVFVVSMVMDGLVVAIEFERFCGIHSDGRTRGCYGVFTWFPW